MVRTRAYKNCRLLVFAKITRPFMKTNTGFDKFIFLEEFIMNRMTDMTKEVIEIIDEAQSLAVKMLVDSGALADIADEEEAIKTLALSNKALKVTKEYSMAQAEMFDEMNDKIARIENVVVMTAEHQRYLSSSLEELNGKIDKLMKKLDKLNTNKED